MELFAGKSRENEDKSEFAPLPLFGLITAVSPSAMIICSISFEALPSTGAGKEEKDRTILMKSK